MTRRAYSKTILQRMCINHSKLPLQPAALARCLRSAGRRHSRTRRSSSGGRRPVGPAVRGLRVDLRSAR